MSEKVKIKEKIFTEEQIPKEFGGIYLSENDRERLMYGEETSLLQNIKLKGENNTETIRDAKIKLVKGPNGAIEVRFNFKEPTLEIPKKILGKDISKEEENSLINGTLISVKEKGNNYYVGLDKDLNKITVKTEKEIGMINDFCGYKLTDEDKLKLANGNKLSTKVFKTKEGYFIGNISMTEDKRGIEINNFKAITPEQAKELEKQFAQEQSNEKLVGSIITEASKTINDSKLDNQKNVSNDIDNNKQNELNTNVSNSVIFNDSITKDGNTVHIQVLSDKDGYHEVKFERPNGEKGSIHITQDSFNDFTKAHSLDKDAALLGLIAQKIETDNFIDPTKKLEGVVQNENTVIQDTIVMKDEIVKNKVEIEKGVDLSKLKSDELKQFFDIEKVIYKEREFYNNVDIAKYEDFYIKCFDVDNGTGDNWSTEKKYELISKEEVELLLNPKQEISESNALDSQIIEAIKTKNYDELANLNLDDNYKPSQNVLNEINKIDSFEEKSILSSLVNHSYADQINKEANVIIDTNSTKKSVSQSQDLNQSFGINS